MRRVTAHQGHPSGRRNLGGGYRQREHRRQQDGEEQDAEQEKLAWPLNEAS